MNDARLNLTIWAAGLIIAGVVLLLFNFDLLVFDVAAQYVAGIVLALAAAGFFGGYMAKRANWWRLAPGWTLLALAGMAFLSMWPAAPPRLIAAVLLLGLALAFGNIYVVNRQDNWWAIIPSGFMLTVSVVTGLSAVAERLETLGAALFVGMGLVFLALSVALRTRSQWWPLIPAAVLIWFGLFVFSFGDGQVHTLLRWWPAALVLIGLAMGWRAAIQRKRPEKVAVNVAPAAPKPKSSQAPAEAAPDADADMGVLGAYSEPAPGASVEVLADEENTRQP